eukprot:529969_1
MNETTFVHNMQLNTNKLNDTDNQFVIGSKYPVAMDDIEHFLPPNIPYDFDDKINNSTKDEEKEIVEEEMKEIEQYEEVYYDDKYPRKQFAMMSDEDEESDSSDDEESEEEEDSESESKEESESEDEDIDMIERKKPRKKIFQESKLNTYEMKEIHKQIVSNHTMWILWQIKENESLNSLNYQNTLKNELKEFMVTNNLFSSGNGLWPRAFDRLTYFKLKDKFFKYCLENPE